MTEEPRYYVDGKFATTSLMGETALTAKATDTNKGLFMGAE